MVEIRETVEEKLNGLIQDKKVTLRGVSEKTGIPYRRLTYALREGGTIKGDELLRICAFISVEPTLLIATEPQQGEAV